MHCGDCRLIFVPEKYFPTSSDEKSRYELHQNSPEDEGYSRFLNSFIDSFIEYLEPGMTGLDYGSGPKPVLAQLLIERDYPVSVYDPFFSKTPELLEKKYDFITCCETVEHFFKPAEEFLKLHSLLNPSGLLCISTAMLKNVDEFSNWYYHHDFTHVVFYCEDTFNWIAEEFGFNLIKVENNFVILNRNPL